MNESNLYGYGCSVYDWDDLNSISDRLKGIGNEFKVPKEKRIKDLKRMIKNEKTHLGKIELQRELNELRSNSNYR